MMGRTHAMCGAAAMLTALSITGPHHSSPTSLTPATIAVATLTAAGAALLPDLDHPHSTISRSLGPISRLLSNLTTAISGGHRHATHSLLGLIAATLIAGALLHLDPTVLAVAIGFLTALGAGSLGITSGRPTRLLLVGGVLAATMLGFSVGVETSILPWAIGIGIATHIVTDMLTGDGVALLHPWRCRIGIGALTTGGTIEKFLIAPSVAIMIVVQLWQLLWTGGVL